jgi:hypothetical protein
MRIPEFTAEASLGKPQGHHQARISVNFVTSGSVQPQSCWCSEPDWHVVCHAGRCAITKTCLQWTCLPN